MQDQITCSTDGCDRPAWIKKRGLCKPCYRRDWARRNPDKVVQHRERHGNGYVHKGPAPFVECEHCGTKWQTWQHARWCSDACANKNRKRNTIPLVCWRCGESFMGARRSQRFCSAACGRAKGTGLARHAMQYPLVATGGPTCVVKQPKPRTWYGCGCVDCGEAFTATTMRSYCSRLCMKRANRRQRKALERGATKRERVYRKKVYERDSWCCQLCGFPVDPNPSRPTDRHAPSLDHILPLSLGGEHTYDNVQLAHYACNSAKGPRIAA